MTIPTSPSESFKARNPHLYPRITAPNGPRNDFDGSDGVQIPPKPSKPVKPRLNGLESRYRDRLVGLGITPLEQAITLRLDPPFTSYRPDLAYMDGNVLTFIECKGKHRFREKGIAKVALAAKTYPAFRFYLVERYEEDARNDGWTATLMTP